MDSSRGYLKLKLPAGGEQEYEISKSEITIGRAQTNDIVLQDSKVSRAHARFEFNDKGEVEVHDLGSTNGVRVNGVRVEKAVISPEDVIFIGGSEIRFERAAVDEAEMTVIDTEADLDLTIANFTMPVAINDTSEDRLVIYTPDKTWEVPLGGKVDALTIGRADTNDIIIEHPSVSRVHARIVRDHRTFVIKDLNSINGIWVGDVKREEVVLEDSVSVMLGYATLVFKSGFREEHLTIAGTSFKVPNRHPVVFVPGIMGSELWLGKERIWPNLKLLFKEPQFLTYPGIKEIEPRGILQEVVVVPNLIKLEQYSRLGDYLVEDLGYTRGVDFFEFAYDWRQYVW